MDIGKVILDKAKITSYRLMFGCTDTFKIKSIESVVSDKLWNAINAFIHYFTLKKNDFSLKKNDFSLKKNDFSLKRNHFSLKKNKLIFL